MIISHKHKFIFIKTQKTAGTSIEIALSKFCGPEDIITPLSPDDEEVRRALGFRGPQNYTIPFKQYSKLQLAKLILNRKQLAFYNHASTRYIMKYIDRTIWESYFKFCFERNPWDKAVSYYYYKNRGNADPETSLSEFIQAGRANVIMAFNLYSDKSEIVVDRVYKYEHIDQAMEEIRDQLHLEETPSLPKTKAHFRKDRRSYRDLLTEEDSQKIAKIFAREIAFFGYEY